jgi:hypothetical protein
MEGRRKHRGEAVVLTTLSANGFPHHSFLSEDEWHRPDERTVSIAVLTSSRTAANLLERKLATLLFLAPGEVRTAFLRLRRRPVRLEADAERSRLVLTVRAEVAATTPPGEVARLDRPLQYLRWLEPADKARRKRVKEELTR